MKVLRFWLPITLCFLTVLCSGVSGQTEEVPMGFDSVVPTDQAYLGWRYQMVDLGDGSSGLRLFEVSPDGPAAQAGLEVGDVITQINGESSRFENDLELVLWMRQFRAGGPLELGILRGASKRLVQVDPIAIPASKRAALTRWIEIARERLSQSEELYCDQVGCEEERPAGAWTTTPRFSQVLRSLEGRAEITVMRGATPFEWQIQAMGRVNLPGGFDIEDFPKELRQSFEALAPGESRIVEITRHSASSSYRIQLLQESP